LAHAFLKKYGLGKVTRFADDALATLRAYAWPGNIRELQNVIERACALAEGDDIERRDLPDYVLTGPALRAGVGPSGLPSGLTTDIDQPLRDAKEQWMQVLEASYLERMLERHGNISAAAKVAGVDRKTFHRLLTKHRRHGAAPEV
jgi:transcriptional regulator of acetoin/glycerol metabolism